MSIAYQVKPTVEKVTEINELLSGYWSNDIWDITDSFFDDLRSEKWSLSTKTINFSSFKPAIRDEVKYMFAHRLQEREIRLTSVVGYGPALKQFAEFLDKYYPGITSIVELSYDKALLQWRTFLISKGISVNENGEISNKSYEVVFNQLHSFFTNLYDTREEHEKDVWDCRRIPGARITESTSLYYLNFTDIPLVFRDLVKRFIKFRTTNNSERQLRKDIMALRLFTKHIHIQEPSWKDLKQLTRKHMEDYLTWYKDYTEGWEFQHLIYMLCLRLFLDYIQRAQYPEAPELPSVLLLFKEDMPKLPQKTENDIKYIPEGVLQQLEDNLDHLTPAEYIPVIVLLRASGWRISDVFNLRYDTCLDRTSQG